MGLVVFAPLNCLDREDRATLQAMIHDREVSDYRADRAAQVFWEVCKHGTKVRRDSPNAYSECPACDLDAYRQQLYEQAWAAIDARRTQRAKRAERRVQAEVDAELAAYQASLRVPPRPYVPGMRLIAKRKLRKHARFSKKR